MSVTDSVTQLARTYDDFGIDGPSGLNVFPPDRPGLDLSPELILVVKPVAIGFLIAILEFAPRAPRPTAMRVSFAILIAVVAVFTSSGLASASNPSQLQQFAPESTNNVEKTDGGARFLRKRLEDESVDLTSEERGVFGDLAKQVKQFLNGETRLAKLFDKTDKKLLKKEVGPNTLVKAAERLEKAGWPAAKIEQFKARAEQYSTFYYRNFPDVRGP